jgi:hypothetical protein
MMNGLVAPANGAACSIDPVQGRAWGTGLFLAVGRIRRVAMAPIDLQPASGVLHRLRPQ